jgi:CO/xanthine dehydrogenase FAD-binding subunit
LKPPAFDYHAPRSVDQAIDLLRSRGEDAKLLAGGQSLGPLLNLRLVSPSVLVDINRIDDLVFERIDNGGSLCLGSMVRQRAIERSSAVRTGWPLLTEAVSHVGHPAIRNRGTIGGSLAHADPAAELPAVAVALDAMMVVRGPASSRRVPAGEFFVSVLTTSMAPDEMLVEVRFPRCPPHMGHCWAEFAPRPGDYAMVGVAATVTLEPHGTYREVRVVYTGVADVPRLISEVGRELAGAVPSPGSVAEAAATAAALLEPASDVLASAAYKRHLAQVLTCRAVMEATRRARNPHEP